MPKTLAVGKVNKYLLLVNAAIAGIYISWWFNWSNVGVWWLYVPLLSGEIYHVIMAVGFWFTVWPEKIKTHDSGVEEINNEKLWADVFITVAGEPVEVVRETALAAREMTYPNFNVFILNDGKVAKKENWQEMEKLAHQLDIGCITRSVPGGAKAGNINNALKQTGGDVIVIFDADMVPHKDFLLKTMPQFNDAKTGFVQTPQYYKNYPVNQVASSAWEQQELFFGPIMAGKDKSNAAFICGTNVAIRRSALIEAGGMNEHNIAEDFLTSLVIHQHGWKSIYINEVLAEGLAPEDMLSYYKQQLRWARGSLEVLFSQNPFFKSGLTMAQRIEYLNSALYYANGVIVVIDMLMPLLFMFFGLEAVKRTTISFAIFFLPFIMTTLYTLAVASGQKLSFQAISFSYSSWPLQLKAIWSVLTGKKMAFSVTPKQAQTGNYLFLAYPHITYALMTLAGIITAAVREGMTPSVATNAAWALINVVLFTPFIIAAGNWRTFVDPIPDTNLSQAAST